MLDNFNTKIYFQRLKYILTMLNIFFFLYVYMNCMRQIKTNFLRRSFLTFNVIFRLLIEDFKYIFEFFQSNKRLLNTN